MEEVHDSKYWFRKRMEQIPIPRATGESAGLTKEEIAEGRKKLIQLMKESGVDTTGLE